MKFASALCIRRYDHSDPGRQTVRLPLDGHPDDAIFDDVAGGAKTGGEFVRVWGGK